MTEQEPEIVTLAIDQKNNTAIVEKTKVAQEKHLEENLQLLQKAIKDLHHE